VTLGSGWYPIGAGCKGLDVLDPQTPRIEYECRCKCGKTWTGECDWSRGGCYAGFEGDCNPQNSQDSCDRAVNAFGEGFCSWQQSGSKPNPVDRVPDPDYHYFNPASGELVVHACVGTIASIAFKDCAKIKKVTFKHTVSNPVIIQSSAFNTESGVEVLDVPPRATFMGLSFFRAYGLKSLVFRDSSDYKDLKIEGGAFLHSGIGGYRFGNKEIPLCAPLICAFRPPSD
jgi:hypothetical protein